MDYRGGGGGGGAKGYVGPPPKLLGGGGGGAGPPSFYAYGLCRAWEGVCVARISRKGSKVLSRHDFPTEIYKKGYNSVVKNMKNFRSCSPHIV